MSIAWSERALAALQGADVCGEPDASTALSPAQRELEESLRDAAGGRGMPRLDGVQWGHACARAAAPDVAPELPQEGTLVAWSTSRGPLYLTGDGELLHPDEGLMGAAVAEIERSAWRVAGWAPESLAIYPPIGEALSTDLDVPWREEASDDAGLTYANEDYLFIDEDHCTRVWARQRALLKPVLARAQDAGALVEAGSTTTERRTNSGEPGAPRSGARNRNSASPVPGRTPDYDRRVEGSDVAVRIWCDDGALLRVTSRGDRVVAEDRFGDDVVTRIAPPSASQLLQDKLTRRALAYLEQHGVLLDAGLTCARERLVSELERRGLEVNDALLDLEERFGGLVIPHLYDPSAIGQLMFGVFQMLHAPPRLRRRLRWDGEEEAELEPTTWPQMRYQHDVLTLVGLQHVEERLYCDGSGAIYRYAGECDLFRAEAGSAAGFFELMGLRAHAARTIGQIAWLRVDADVGDRLAKELELARVPEASDHVAVHWLSESHWVWRQSSFGPNDPATFLAAASPALVVEGARRMLSLASGGKLKLQTAGPGGAARLEALQAEGIVVAS